MASKSVATDEMMIGQQPSILVLPECNHSGALAGLAAGERRCSEYEELQDGPSFRVRATKVSIADPRALRVSVESNSPTSRAEPQPEPAMADEPAQDGAAASSDHDCKAGAAAAAAAEDASVVRSREDRAVGEAR